MKTNENIAEYRVIGHTKARSFTVPSAYNYINSQKQSIVSKFGYEVDTAEGKKKVQLQPITIRDGRMVLNTTYDAPLIKHLDEWDGNKSNKLAPPHTKKYIERVNYAEQAKEKSKRVLSVYEAVKAIKDAAPDKLINYGKRMQFGEAFELEKFMIANPKVKDEKLKKSEEYQLLEDVIATHAGSNPEAFSREFVNAMNPVLAHINEALEEEIIVFTAHKQTWDWKNGIDLSMIAQVPNGMNREEWFATWLMGEGNATYEELISKLKIRKVSAE